jgi:hypothetical protein
MDDVLFVTLIIVTIACLFFTAWGCQASFDRVNLCVANGYGGNVSLNGQNYCYRLAKDGGILINFDTLKGK